MEVFWIAIAWILMIGGILGCVLPFLPGPPLSYAALVVQYFLISDTSVTVNTLIVTGIATAIVTALDFIIPIWGTKQFGGSKTGMWGATIGLVLGMFFFPPLGMFIGTAIGALIGELIHNKEDFQRAIAAAFGSLIGFLIGAVAKVAVCVWMLFYLVPDTYIVLKNLFA